MSALAVTYRVDTLPKTFSYSRTIGPTLNLANYQVVNTATFVTNDTATTGSDSWTVTVQMEGLFVPGDFCTYTQGGGAHGPTATTLALSCRTTSMMLWRAGLCAGGRREIHPLHYRPLCGPLPPGRWHAQ